MDPLNATLTLAVLLLASGSMLLVVRARRLEQRCHTLSTSVDLLMDCSQTMGQSLEQAAARTPEAAPASRPGNALQSAPSAAYADPLPSEPASTTADNRMAVAGEAAASSPEPVLADPGAPATTGDTQHASVLQDDPPATRPSAPEPASDAPEEHVSHTETRLQARLAAR